MNYSNSSFALLTGNFDKFIQVKISFFFPNSIREAEIFTWASILFGNDEFNLNRQAINFDKFTYQKQLFIQFFIETIRFQCQISKIPLFDVPDIVNLDKQEGETEQYNLIIKLPCIDYFPKKSYRTVIQTSMYLCNWIAQNRFTSDNLNKVCVFISEKVIKPLGSYIPGGQSTIPILKVAHINKIPFRHMGLGIYQLGCGSKARFLDRSACEFDSSIGSRLVQNKVVCAHILRDAGFPSPVHDVVENKRSAVFSANQIGFPVVIKPIDLDRGEGVTVDVSNDLEVINAFAYAQKISKSKQVIVERQILGICHRFFIVNQKVLYTIKRNPISVIGDGKSTVKELVDNELYKQNKIPIWNRSKIKSIDDLARKIFEKKGISENFIPNIGEMVSLRPIQSTEWGGSPEDISKIVHNDNLKLAIKAAELFKLHTAGVDIISPDITKPWHLNGAIINEVNFAPLLGGVDISKMYIPDFLSEFIRDGGQIPIEVFEKEDLAKKFQIEKIKMGDRCYFTSANRTFDDDEDEIFLPMIDLKKRIIALLLRRDVDSISVFNPD